MSATWTGSPRGEAEIRRLFAGWAKAICAKDVDGSLANYAPDVLAFDLITPLQYSGSAALRERLERWFSSFSDPTIGYENRDLHIVADDEVAFAHSLNHVSAATTGGQRIHMWWRATVCFRAVDGAWLVTHSHSSVPFDMETGQASLALEP